MKYTHVSCSRCGARVSNTVAVNDSDMLVVRAFIECGACIEKQPDYETRIKEYEQEAVFLREQGIAHHEQIKQLRAACVAASLAIKRLVPFAQIGVAGKPMATEAGELVELTHQAQEHLQTVLS